MNFLKDILISLMIDKKKYFAISTFLTNFAAK